DRDQRLGVGPGRGGRAARGRRRPRRGNPRGGRAWRRCAGLGGGRDRLGRFGFGEYPGEGGVRLLAGDVRVGAQFLQQLLELIGEALLVAVQRRAVAVPVAGAVLLVNQIDRQRRGGTQFGKLAQVIFERDAPLLPPAELQLDLDHLVQGDQPFA